MAFYYLDSDIPTGTAANTIHEARTAADSDLYQVGDIVEAWDTVFRWDDDCIAQSKMLEWRKRGDQLADVALPILTSEAGQAGGTDLLGRLEASVTGPSAPQPEVQALWHQLHTQDLGDAWPSKEQIQRGQAVFYRYAPHFLSSLLHFSLSGGFSSPRISRVLNIASYLTPPMRSTPEGEAPRIDKASNDRSFMRLMETTQFVVDCMGEGAMEIGGAGWSAAIRVRLLHATMRRRVLEKARREKATGSRVTYDQEKEGIPISMEDMAGTLTSFCPAPLICAMKVGLVPSRQECDDYLALWRVIGYYLGIDEDILCFNFANYHQSTRLFACTLVNVYAGESDPPPPCQFPFESLAPGVQRVKQITPPMTDFDEYKSPATLPVLFCICNRWPIPFNFPQHCAATRQLLGPTLSDWLSVPETSRKELLGLKIGFKFVNIPPRFALWWRKGWDEKRRHAMQRSVEDAVAIMLGARKQEHSSLYPLSLLFYRSAVLFAAELWRVQGRTKFRPRAEGAYEPAKEPDEADATSFKSSILAVVGEWGLIYAEMAAIMLSPLALGAGAVWYYQTRFRRAL